MSIDNKDGVVALLERLERVTREIKNLPDIAKRLMALQAGCLESDLEVLQDEVTQALEVVRELRDADDIPILDIKDPEHRSVIRDALSYLDSLDDDSQVEVFDVVVSEITCFDTDIERLNDCLVDAKKPWRVIDTEQYNTLKELVDSI